MPTGTPARVTLVVSLATVLLAASVGAWTAATLPVPGAGLFSEIPAGTRIGVQGLEVLFVVEQDATLVGAWTATAGGLFRIVAADARTGPMQAVCGATPHWEGRANESLHPGTYYVGLLPNPYGTILVTQTIRFGPLTHTDFISGMVEGVGCTPPNIIGPPHGGG